MTTPPDRFIPPAATFADWIRQAGYDHDWTDAKLADLLGITVPTLRSYKNGDPPPRLTIETLARLTNLLFVEDLVLWARTSAKNYRPPASADPPLRADPSLATPASLRLVLRDILRPELDRLLGQLVELPPAITVDGLLRALQPRLDDLALHLNTQRGPTAPPPSAAEIAGAMRPVLADLVAQAGRGTVADLEDRLQALFADLDNRLEHAYFHALEAHAAAEAQRQHAADVAWRLRKAIQWRWVYYGGCLLLGGGFGVQIAHASYPPEEYRASLGPWDSTLQFAGCLLGCGFQIGFVGLLLYGVYRLASYAETEHGSPWKPLPGIFIRGGLTADLALFLISLYPGTNGTDDWKRYCATHICPPPTATPWPTWTPNPATLTARPLHPTTPTLGPPATASPQASRTTTPAR
jgi:transcriptional regulator with XRE-family HTH domain